MPRARKTATGYDAQAATPVAGQTYGMGVEQQRMAEAMPTPNMSAPPATAAAAPAPAVAPARPSLEGVLAQAKGVNGGGGMLNMPTARPGEPVTHGLPSGPGGGPEVIGTPVGTPSGRWMRDLAMRSGNPYMQQLADRLGA